MTAIVSPAPTTSRSTLTLAGGLLVGGFAAFTVATAIHPHGSENDHPVIFAKYADTQGWIAIHFAQFAGVIVALAGFLILSRIFIDRGGSVLLGRLLQAALVATAAVWAVLQAVDGVALKHTVDAWAEASGVERSLRFADAEAVRWAEWGLQAYFRLLFGLTFALAGIAIWRTGVAYRWLGPVAILGGAVYAAVGIAVGHTGLDKPGGPVVQLLFVTFIVGVLVAGLRSTTPSSGGSKAGGAMAHPQTP